jgi:hypothetical protein
MLNPFNRVTSVYTLETRPADANAWLDAAWVTASATKGSQIAASYVINGYAVFRFRISGGDEAATAFAEALNPAEGYTLRTGVGINRRVGAEC